MVKFHENLKYPDLKPGFQYRINTCICLKSINRLKFLELTHFCINLFVSLIFCIFACKKGKGRARSLFERKILGKSPEPENNAQRKVKKENPWEWVRIIWELSSENYHWELSSENYDLVYHHAEKLRFIGILAYPKIFNIFKVIGGENDLN